MPTFVVKKSKQCRKRIDCLSGSASFFASHWSHHRTNKHVVATNIAQKTHPPRKVQNSQQALAFKDRISTAAILGYCYEKIKSQENEIMTPIFYSTAERDWSSGVKSRPNKATVRINKRILISNNTLLSFSVFVAFCCCIFIYYQGVSENLSLMGESELYMLNTVTKCQ